MPILDEGLAPCFEVARYFMVCDITNPDEVTISIEKCSECEGFGRIRFLQDNHITTLICNGIKSFYRDLLIADGINVVPNISLTAKEALDSHLHGKLKFDEGVVVQCPTVNMIPHDDLVCWARDLFTSNGYKLSEIDKLSHSLIDFIAEINCPVCAKLIRVAVCCGAHTYDYAQDIRHFHYSTSSNYQARVYVYTADSELIKTCKEYNVELIDPKSEESLIDKPVAGRIPILRNPTEGHERACLVTNDINETDDNT